MTTKKKWLIAVAVCTVFFISCISVFAQQITEAISVVYDNYRIIIDGADKSATPEDSKPFVFNGRTYVPLRYIAESMGKQVLWDGATKTIYINDEGNSREDVYFATQSYDWSDTDIILDGDKKIVRLSTMVHNQNYDYREGDKGFSKRNIVFNLNGTAKNVIGTIDMSETSPTVTNEGKVIFYDQDEKILYQSSYLRNSTEPIPFNFSVQGALQLEVEFIGVGTHGSDICVIDLKDFRYTR